MATVATKKNSAQSTLTAEQKRRDIEKYSEMIFYSARYSGERFLLIWPRAVASDVEKF